MKPEATLYSFRFVFLERSGTPEAQRREQERIPLGSLGQLTPRTPVRVDAPYGVLSYRHHAPGQPS